MKTQQTNFFYLFRQILTNLIVVAPLTNETIDPLRSSFSAVYHKWVIGLLNDAKPELQICPNDDGFAVGTWVLAVFCLTPFCKYELVIEEIPFLEESDRPAVVGLLL